MCRCGRTSCFPDTHEFSTKEVQRKVHPEHLKQGANVDRTAARQDLRPGHADTHLRRPHRTETSPEQSGRRSSRQDVARPDRRHPGISGRIHHGLPRREGTDRRCTFQDHDARAEFRAASRAAGIRRASISSATTPSSRPSSPVCGVRIVAALRAPALRRDLASAVNASASTSNGLGHVRKISRMRLSVSALRPIPGPITTASAHAIRSHDGVIPRKRAFLPPSPEVPAQSPRASGLRSPA